MIEITTGIVFLLSSLYGTGHADVHADIVASEISLNRAIVENMTTLTDSKSIEKYIRTAYKNEPILIDIARCESTFRQYDEYRRVIRGRVNKEDVGVMQINEKYHADLAAKFGVNIYTVEGNVAYAKHLYDKFGAQPWVSSSKCWAQPTGDLAVN